MPNIYQMYIENRCKFGFYVSRNSWSNKKYAKVIAIEDVEEGKMIDGDPPYFNRKYPTGHPKAGKIIQGRIITLEAKWFEGGIYEDVNGGTFVWTQVYPISH